MINNKSKDENIGLLSWASLRRSLERGTTAEGYLKVATIYYDRLVFPQSRYLVEQAIDSIVKVEGAKDDKVRSVWQPIELVAPELFSIENALQNSSSSARWYLDKLFYNNPEESSAFWEHMADGGQDSFTDLILSSFFTSSKSIDLVYNGSVARKGFGGIRDLMHELLADVMGISKYQVKKRDQSDKLDHTRTLAHLIVASVGSALLWSGLRNYLDCVFVTFSRFEKVIGQQLVSQGKANQANSYLKSLEAYVPSVRNLPWKDVFELREDKRVIAFRKWLSGLSNLDVVTEKDSLQYATDKLWEAAKEIKPNLRSEVIEGVVSNIPLPIPLNPIGLVYTAKSIAEAYQTEKKYNWLFFLHKMESLSKAKNRDR